jgi:hypothetical protein
MLKNSSDPIEREMFGLLERHGRSYYHTESVARGVAREAAKEIKQLADALEAAQKHLEYCNYGDKWERECAEGDKLEEKINVALRGVGRVSE